MLEKIIGATILDVGMGATPSLLFITTNKGLLHFYHNQDCCESVWLEDGFEDLKRMIGEKVFSAKEVTNHNIGEMLPCSDVSFTWTYYNISTLYHDCTLRFYGTSNGWYSESVDVEWLDR